MAISSGEPLPEWTVIMVGRSRRRTSELARWAAEAMAEAAPRRAPAGPRRSSRTPRVGLAAAAFFSCLMSGSILPMSWSLWFRASRLPRKSSL